MIESLPVLSEIYPFEFEKLYWIHIQRHILDKVNDLR